MAQGFYNLEEAAQRLGMQPQQLNQMAQRREVRAFADRGTWRFRVPDIEELARQRGMSSDPDLQLGDDATKAAPAKAAAKAGETIPLGVDPESVDIFELPAKKPKTGSDSDIRLVAEGSDLELRVDSDSDVKLSPSDSDVRLEKEAGKVPGSDSGIKLVSDSDSDVKIIPESPSKSGTKLTGKKKTDEKDAHIVPVGGEKATRSPSDSDIRLDLDMHGQGDSDVRLIGDEPAGASPSAARKSDSGHVLSTEEPLLLAEDSAVGSSVDVSAKPAQSDASSDFDLTPGLEEETPSPSDSGISIEPADSQASSDADMDFDLMVDDGKGKKAVVKDEAAESEEESSEFELSLESDAGLAPEHKKTEEIDETNLKVPAKADESGALAYEDTTLEGSSEFELAMEEGSPAEDSEMESDLEVFEEEGTEAVEEGATAAEEVSDELEGEVVDDLLTEPALEGEEVLEGEALAEGELVGAAALAPAIEMAPAEWGAMPALVLIPTTICLMFVGFLLFEMLRSVWSYNEPGFISGLFSEMLGGLMK